MKEKSELLLDEIKSPACNLNIVKELVKGVDLNQKLKDNRTFLHFAFDNNRLTQDSKFEVIRYLIEIGVDPEAKNIHGNNCLHFACQDNNFALIKMLIEEYRMDPNGKDGQGKNGLYLVVANNPDRELVDYLYKHIHIKNKIPISESTNIRGWNYLHAVCQEKNVTIDMIQYLIDIMRIDPLERTKDNVNCLDIACGNYASLEVIKYLIEEKKVFFLYHEDVRNETLKYACMGKVSRIDVIDYLTNKHGFDIHARFPGSETLLHIICKDKNPNLELFKYLIEEKKLNPGVKNLSNMDCLDLACKSSDSLDIVKYLMDECGSVSRGCLFYACDRTDINTDIIIYLISKKCNEKIIDYQGRDAFFLACQNAASLEVIKSLGEYFNLKAVDLKKRFYLHAACSSSTPDLEVITYLIDIGMDVNQSGGIAKETTPLDIVMKWLNKMEKEKHKSIIKKLLCNGAVTSKNISEEANSLIKTCRDELINLPRENFNFYTKNHKKTIETLLLFGLISRNKKDSIMLPTPVVNRLITHLNESNLEHINESCIKKFN